MDRHTQTGWLNPTRMGGHQAKITKTRFDPTKTRFTQSKPRSALTKSRFDPIKPRITLPKSRFAPAEMRFTYTKLESPHRWTTELFQEAVIQYFSGGWKIFIFVLLLVYSRRNHTIVCSLFQNQNWLFAFTIVIFWYSKHLASGRTHQSVFYFSYKCEK